LPVVDLGRMRYDEALAVQRAIQSDMIGGRGEAARNGSPDNSASHRSVGRVLLVEHDPVITITARAGARDHLLASPELLAARGVALCETDRGGDITYHGPGQIVAYPILDLNALNLGLHEHMSLMESAVIETCARFGVAGHRDPAARGVWVRLSNGEGESAKICAMGVRVRHWVSMHGLALNVTPDLGHFGLIVPCGLAGRPITSLAAALGAGCPEIREVKAELARRLVGQVRAAWERAQSARASGPR